MHLHLLTPGFTTPNGAAFLFPFIHFKQALREAGITFHFHHKVTDDLFRCSHLLVDSKFHKDHWLKDTPGTIREFQGFKERVGRLIYCDTTDSSSWIQTELLPVVDVYAKAQLLKDRTHYLRPLYGHRLFADYYHKNYGIEDSKPESSQPVNDPVLLNKLALSWNSGIADYSLYGPYKMMAYHYLPCPLLLRAPQPFGKPEAPRGNELHCRMGISYHRESVAWQRKQIKALLHHRLPTDKLPRKAFFAELANSNIILSPFGWGEITLKDFEAFLAGGALMKPDMGHMETWPNWYSPRETYIPFSWDVKDLEAEIEVALADEPRRIAIAKAGQARYVEYTDKAMGAPHFVEHLQELLSHAA